MSWKYFSADDAIQATPGDSFVTVAPKPLAVVPDYFYTPPAGWNVDSGPTVITFDNQWIYANGPMDNCGLRALAQNVGGTATEADYAPPIGWAVVLISRPAGAGVADLKDVDTIWISPDGVATSTKQCDNQVGQAGAVVTKKDLQPPEPPKAAAVPWWILIGGAAVAAWLIWRK